MSREIDIAEKTAKLCGAAVGHGSSAVISFDGAEIKKKYFGGGGIRRAFYTVSFRSAVQKTAMENVLGITELFLQCGAGGIIGVKRNGLSGKVYGNGIWVYSCRVSVEFFDETV